MKMGDKDNHKKNSDTTNHPMTEVLGRFREPTETDWKNAWVGMEPTFQSEKSIKLWGEFSAKEGGEDKYFEDKYMLDMERRVASEIVEKYEKKLKEKHSYCMFAKVKHEADLDRWGVRRQCLEFKWADGKFADFKVRFGIDPETFEYSIKPVPMAWFYDEDFVRFLQDFFWEVPIKAGLKPSLAHGGGQFSISAKAWLGGSLLADDFATRLNHPELSTFIFDWPNPGDRQFRATRDRFQAVKTVIDAYWAGRFHPGALGEPRASNAIFDHGWGPAPADRSDLMDSKLGPIGTARQLFQTNFAFGRAMRLQGQNIHPGYWQSAHPKETGYRPDQIMRYSEINLNRLQIAGECHVKSGQVLNRVRVPEFDAPLDLSMLYDEASWEDRAQMGKTSARDFTEALLLDVHFAQWLQANPHVKIVESILQDQINGDAISTLRRNGAEKRLDELRREARKANLEASDGRVKSDWIEPETLIWESWKVLPIGEKAAIAREIMTGFISRVQAAASMDKRESSRNADPMELHRHRILPILWDVLDRPEVGLKAGDQIQRELEAWKSNRNEYLSRRPVFSHINIKEPWKL